MAVKDVIRIAMNQIGYTENPPGSNLNKYGEVFGLSGVPWCVIFLWWCFHEAGEGKAFYGGNKTASCGELLRFHKAIGQTAETPAPGDIVILNFHGGKDTEHCGLVINTQESKIFTVEGNTTISGQPEDNGGIVANKTRYQRQIVGIIRPVYLPADVPPDSWAADSVRYCLEYGYMHGYPDGLFMPNSPITRAELAAVIKRFKA